MVVLRFPPVELSDESGLLAVGGDLDPESLLLAYRTGIFPWPPDESTLAWFAPKQRAILRFDELHVSRSLWKEIRRSSFSVTINRSFPEVIRRCAEVVNRGTQHGTWITSGVMEAYEQLHRLGFAYSVECWSNGALVGGLYGVTIGRMFGGESMFYREEGASKVALLSLIRLLVEHGVEWLDCQVLTPHMEHFGAKEIPQRKFSVLLDRAIHGPVLDLSPRELPIPRSAAELFGPSKRGGSQ
jgi:leucyl/phenylalanyl-tRNA---protein transferase